MVGELLLSVTPVSARAWKHVCTRYAFIASGVYRTPRRARARTSTAPHLDNTGACCTASPTTLSLSLFHSLRVSVCLCLTVPQDQSLCLLLSLSLLLFVSAGVCLSVCRSLSVSVSRSRSHTISHTRSLSLSTSLSIFLSPFHPSCLPIPSLVQRALANPFCSLPTRSQSFLPSKCRHLQGDPRRPDTQIETAEEGESRSYLVRTCWKPGPNSLHSRLRFHEPRRNPQMSSSGSLYLSCDAEKVSEAIATAVVIFGFVAFAAAVGAVVVLAGSSLVLVLLYPRSWCGSCCQLTFCASDVLRSRSLSSPTWGS